MPMLKFTMLDGTPLWVNPKLIEAVSESEEQTLIWFYTGGEDDEGFFVVKESADFVGKEVSKALDGFQD